MGGLRARRYGRIVNMSSIAAIGTALAGNAFYAATKAEVVILTRRFLPWSWAHTASPSTLWRPASSPPT
jgi:NAD(P)-dependent dehydrogenase (short-subunit alcohol dehydrogenase family)